MKAPATFLLSVLSAMILIAGTSSATAQCPTVSNPASGSYSFCGSDAGMDLATVESLISVEPALPPLQNDGIVFYTEAGNPPGNPYTPGSLQTDLDNGCDPLVQTIFAYYLCDLYGDDSSIEYVAAGSFEIAVYPDLTSMAITIDDDGTCSPSITFFECQGSAGYTVTNDYDNNGAEPDFSAETSMGSLLFTVANVNAPAICNVQAQVTYNCIECPITIEPTEVIDICSGDNVVLPNEIISASIYDPFGTALGAPDPIVAWYEDAVLQVPFLGGELIHSGIDSCAIEQVTLYASITCTIDNSIIPAGSLLIMIYPDLQNPIITLDDDVCNYSLHLACPENDLVISNDFTMNLVPGDGAGNAGVEIGNQAGCYDHFSVPYEACEGGTVSAQSLAKEPPKLRFISSQQNLILHTLQSGQAYQISIFDLAGRHSFSQTFYAESDTWQLPLPDFAPGVYCVQLQGESVQTAGLRVLGY